jgi:hypothetical protein
MVAMSWWRSLWWKAPLIAGVPLLEWIARGWCHRASEVTTIFFPGRPLRVDTIVQIPAPVPARMESHEGELLGRLWVNDGLAEQASIAAFGQLALQLMRFGAPAQLLCDAHLAALDEIAHARLCFSLANRYGHARHDAVPFSAATCVDRDLDLPRLMEDSIIDGAFAEGFAASALAWSATRAQDRAVRAVLTRLGRDEARHAALGWDIALWALHLEPIAMRAHLPRVCRRLSNLRLDVSAYPEGLCHHGRLDASSARRIFEATRSEVADRLAICEREMTR